MNEQDIKGFYSGYRDRITGKRFHSPYALRRYAHLKQYEAFLKHVKPEDRVLDAGCGEGVLSFMLAERGAIVTGADLSQPNIEATKARATGRNGVKFMVADLEHLPFADNSFDLAVSSHVLEHLPDFDRGLQELMRVTTKRAIIAIPTLCNLCSLTQVGGGWFYLKGVRSFAGLFIGMAKALFAWISGAEGVNEDYAPGKMPHVFRFPSVFITKAKANGYKVESYEASSLCLPFFSFLLPLIKWLDKYKDKPVLRNYGYGTTYIVDKS